MHLRWFLILFCCVLEYIHCDEFTIEIDDTECFYEDIKEGMPFSFEYQIVSGGFHDFDVVIRYEDGRTVFQSNKKQMESFQWTTDESGTYNICFYTHYMRRIYFGLKVGKDHFFLNKSVSSTVLTNFETSALRLQSNVIDVLDHQTHHRLRESQERIQALKLYKTILKWSFSEMFLLLTIGILQTVVLRKFFS